MLAWYVLRVVAGRERAAAAAVARIAEPLGGEVFLPGSRTWRRRSRRDQRRVRVEQTLAAGYLFVSLPGFVSWKRITDLDLVDGVLCRTVRDAGAGSGGRDLWRREPCPLPASWRAGLGFDNLLAPADAPPDWDAHDYNPGDPVLITHDAFDRCPGKCLAIEGAHARVLVQLFGAEREMTIPAAMAVKARA